jgi:hypothetical protein
MAYADACEAAVAMRRSKWMLPVVMAPLPAASRWRRILLDAHRATRHAPPPIDERRGLRRAARTGLPSLNDP